MKKIFLAITVLLQALKAPAFSTVEGILDGSAIYPGTTHSYIVTVTDNYRPGEPAGLYIGLDGVLMDAPAVIDSLSAKGVIPPMISVFLQPGVVKAGDGEVIRYNRSNEFDAIDGRFASFLETELLPAVGELKMPDGRPMVLPSKPEHRMIMGLSSGGIAALTAALRRPDLIGKVFAGCGTFVPMRGGEQIQALIRKTEPAPLRVFLQDGYRDTWNPLFGSWFEANLLVNSALEFSGVDVAHDWADGVHSVSRATQIFPEVMLWMWRDYPAAPATPKSENSTLKNLLVDGSTWTEQPSGDTHRPTVSLSCPPMKIHVEYQPGSARLLQSVLDTATGERLYTQPFYWLHSLENDDAGVADMAFDAEGNLWVLTRDGLQICDQNGRVRAILRLPVAGAPFKGFEIGKGNVTLYGHGCSFTRPFNVSPLIVAPKSQGPA